MRIVAGTAGGRRLQVPGGRGTRPTSDRAREALFSSLGSRLRLPGSRVLELFAGTGAVGLEAASRGAAEVVLVERATSALRTLRANLATLAPSLSGQLHVLATDSYRLVEREPAPQQGFDLVFADPPYDHPAAQVAGLLAGLLGAGWLTANAVLVIERPSAEPWCWPIGLEADGDKRYGAGRLWYGRRS